jgi:organic hydroperoxide reductase OsmC/OhrA
VTIVSEQISKAMERVRSVFARRPEMAVHADEPATARWDGGLSVVASDANGTHIPTDMPVELGGSGQHLTPGWLLRAALASCLATRIAMEAAAAGITLSRLEVSARSTSDVRGLLGMTDQGTAISPAPRELQLEVRVATQGAAREQVEAMILKSVSCSPVSAALEGALSVALHTDIESD